MSQIWKKTHKLVTIWKVWGTFSARFAFSSKSYPFYITLHWKRGLWGGGAIISLGRITTMYNQPILLPFQPLSFTLSCHMWLPQLQEGPAGLAGIAGHAGPACHAGPAGHAGPAVPTGPTCLLVLLVLLVPVVLLVLLVMLVLQVLLLVLLVMLVLLVFLTYLSDSFLVVWSWMDNPSPPPPPPHLHLQPLSRPTATGEGHADSCRSYDQRVSESWIDR